jgi:hypothetical protein
MTRNLGRKNLSLVLSMSYNQANEHGTHAARPR